MSSVASRTIRLAVAGLVIPGATACSAANEPDVAIGPQETATVAELDAAVAPAAGALLEASGLRTTAVYFGFDDPEQATRFDWLEYRTEGGFFVVSNELDPRRVEAFIQVDAELYTATRTAAGDEPWSALGRQATPPAVFLDLLALVTDIAEQPSALVGGDAVDSEVTRQQDGDGNVLWTFREIGSDPDVIELAAQWLINGAGVLQFYRVGSDVEPIAGSSGIVYEFGIADDLDPLEPPVLGTPLDLEERGVPNDLIDIDE